jgi:hypothetical protein
MRGAWMEASPSVVVVVVVRVDGRRNGPKRLSREITLLPPPLARIIAQEACVSARPRQKRG